MQVYLIRNAQSANQVLDSRDGIVFAPQLTDLGQRQALLLAEHFAADEHRTGFPAGGIDRLTCSPMWRALQTTRPLAEALRLKPEVWVDVHEHVYATEVRRGCARDEISAAVPDYRLPDGITDEGWWNWGAETRSACMERAIRVAEELRRRSDTDESLVIVSPIGFMDSLLKALLDQLPGERRWYHHNNTAVTCLVLTGERLEMRYLNRVAHLPPALVS